MRKPKTTDESTDHENHDGHKITNQNTDTEPRTRARKMKPNYGPQNHGQTDKSTNTTMPRPTGLRLNQSRPWGYGTNKKNATGRTGTNKKNATGRTGTNKKMPRDYGKKNKTLMWWWVGGELGMHCAGGGTQSFPGPSAAVVVVVVVVIQPIDPSRSRFSHGRPLQSNF